MLDAKKGGTKRFKSYNNNEIICRDCIVVSTHVVYHIDSDIPDWN